MKRFIEHQFQVGLTRIYRKFPPFVDDWLVPGLPIKRRFFYAYTRYYYAKEYLLYAIGFWNLMSTCIPHIRKQKILRHYAKKYHIRTCVETGTYLGDMISALSRDFDEIYSIELSRPLYEKASLRFAVFKNIHLYFGDSSTEIVSILSKLEYAALFWLDGHYSGEGTARGNDDSPIVDEVNKIFEYGKLINHVILIDDALLFNGTNGYPQLNTFKKYIIEKRTNYSFLISDNIIILEPIK